METSQELDFKRYVHLLYKKRYLFVAVMVLVTSTVVAYSYTMPKKYEAASTVLIEKKFLTDVMKGITVSPSINDQVMALATVMKSRPLVLKVLKDLDLDLTKMTEQEVDGLVQVFQANTEIKFEINRSNRRDMDMFVVSLKNRNPVVARDYVNALVRRYIEENLSSTRDATYGASKFLLEQIDLFKNKINAIEGKIAEINQQKVDANQERLVALQKKLDDLLLQYTENHPEVVKVKYELETLKGQVIGSRRIPDKNRELDEKRYAARSDDQAAQKRGDEQKIKELERDRDVYRKIYEDMLAALGRSEVSSHIEVQDKGGTFNVLEPAVLPVKPIGQNRVKIILLGIIAGIGAGIGTIILLDSLDKSVKTVDSLNGFGLPVLAVIPHIQIPSEIKKTKIKDLALYAFAGIYYLGVAAVLALEVLGKEIK